MKFPRTTTSWLAPPSTRIPVPFMFTIDSPDLSLAERRSLLDWVIRPALRTVPGVADVNSLGGHVRAFEIVVNIGDRVRDLVLVTPNGCNEISVDVRAHCNGVMRTVIQLRGDAMADGALRVVVKNQEIG